MSWWNLQHYTAELCRLSCMKNVAFPRKGQSMIFSEKRQPSHTSATFNLRSRALCLQSFTRSWDSASGKNAGRLADKTSPLPRLDERRATIKWAVVAWNILQDLLLEEGCRNGFLGETWPLSASNVFLSSQQPHSSPFLFFLIHWAATFIVPWKLGKYVCYGGAQTIGWYIALSFHHDFI